LEKETINNLKERLKMKYLILIILSSVFFFGCQKESNITNPENQKVSWLEKSAGNNFTDPDYICNENRSGLSSEITIVNSKTIIGKDGGKIDLHIHSNPHVSGELEFPKNSFTGTETFTVLYDNETATITFSPSPYQFLIPLKLKLEYKNLDLSGCSPEDLDYYYLSPSGELVPVNYDKIDVKIDNGELKLSNAKIPHFSRYGWIKRH
jgi:hypothetical protein